MASLLEKAASPDILNASWKRLCNDKAVWETGMNRKEFESNFVYHITKLSDELKNKTYQPDPVRFFPINKGDGKSRIISAYTLRDKLAQRAVLTVLEPIGERLFHHDSFAYRPGRTIDMALSRVREYMLCGLDWVVDADIDSYFDNILHNLLLKTVKSSIKDKDINHLIRLWLNAGTVKKGFFSQSKGIPQGAVVSPFLCNLYLTGWDNDMDKMNFPFVRFADDFLVFARSQSEAKKAYRYIQKSLKKLGLMLNPDKTRVAHCGPNVIFLGRKLPDLNRNRIYSQKVNTPSFTLNPKSETKKKYSVNPKAETKKKHSASKQKSVFDSFKFQRS